MATVYLTSISQALTSSHKLSQASIYRLELSVWVTPQTERVIVLLKILALSNSLALLRLLLAVISRQHGNNNRTIPVKERLSQQFCQIQGCFFPCARAILGYDAYDVLLKSVLLANIKRLCWTLQVVE